MPCPPPKRAPRSASQAPRSRTLRVAVTAKAARSRVYTAEGAPATLPEGVTDAYSLKAYAQNQAKGEGALGAAGWEQMTGRGWLGRGRLGMATWGAALPCLLPDTEHTACLPTKPAPSPLPPSGRIIFQGVHHVALLCASLERSLDFYCGVLGLEVGRRPPPAAQPGCRGGAAGSRSECRPE